MSQKIFQFELVDHGLEHSQYFQGCGTCFTSSNDVATGCGDNFQEAIADCLEQIAQGSDDIDIADLEARILEDLGFESFDKIKSPSASAEIQAQIENDRPLPLWRVRFTGHCGMVLEDETFESWEDAREEAKKIMANRESTGHAIDQIRGDDSEGAECSWEIGEPDDSAMVPDTAGILSLIDETPEFDEDEYTENSELYYYVSVRWSMTD